MEPISLDVCIRGLLRVSKEDFWMRNAPIKKCILQLEEACKRKDRIRSETLCIELHNFFQEELRQQKIIWFMPRDEEILQFADESKMEKSKELVIIYTIITECMFFVQKF